MASQPFIADLHTRAFIRARDAARKLDEVCAAAVQEGKRMSIIDKMKLVAEKRVALNNTNDARAQKLLDRYAEVETQFDKAFTKHDARLDSEEAAAVELENAAEALSNMGNLPSS
jgi:hypothetical protein